MILIEVKTLERQTTQLIKNGPTQMVHGNINEPQRSEVGHSLGKLSGERVVVELNLRESSEASERTRDGTVEVVDGEVQDEVPEGVQDGAHKVAAAEP